MTIAGTPEFWTFDIGHIITLIGTLVGTTVIVAGFAYTLRTRVDGLDERMVKMEKGMEKIVDVLINQSRHDEQITQLRATQILQGQRIDETTNRLNSYVDRKFLGPLQP